MKERGILYSAPMVRALLDGSKTQTRRVCKPAQAASLSFVVEVPDPRERGQVYNGSHFGDEEGGVQFACPYGGAGDRLWVRETWMPDPPRDGTWPHSVYDGCKPRDKSLIPEHFRTATHCLYRATWEGPALTGWVPAIHMFRWASRMTHQLTQVRCERLQDITETDAIAEGIQRYAGALRWVRFIDAITGEPTHNSARDAYCHLWEHLNGPGSVEANPWVWALTFKEVK